MLRTSPVRPGDRVAVVAPAGPAPDDRVQAGITALETLGYRVQFEPPPVGRRHYLAGSDTQRADALEAAFEDPDVKAVFALRGGFGCVRTLTRLDLGAIGTNPKPLIGFSDCTALLVHATFACEIETVHGPVVTQLPNLDEASRTHLVRLLAHEATCIPLDADRAVLRAGRARGQLVGGNLSVLTSLIGTRYFPPLAGRIVFFEDVGEPGYRVDRMLTQLRLSGALRGVAGLLIGRFTGTAEGERAAFDDLWSELAEHIDGPVVRGFPIGHEAENHAVPIGRIVTLDTDESILCL